ncbi:CaiB/BaiF CoA transferase family protein [Geodermatophilus normandii]|uniref:CoA transferase n=1 Tax=Geodermatophilus normandii TaxID=1137989 RepID=A0A6P0GL30_9ACTN|nr:CoA transferase [Geodermatophilus normandii]NEM08048.1 CoA transferase [Geodermatophilus normandii]
MDESLFSGLKVIDCGSYIAAPAATTILADLGADVIKIEPPGAGDPYRQLPKLPGNPISEHDYAWLLDSHSKRGLAVDLASPGGQEVLHRLVADADVFVTNYPLRVRDKLHIDWETLSALNDRLIYGSFTGYGETGPEVAKPGFDATSYWARSGMMDQVRNSHEATPARAVIGQGDHPSAMTLYAGLVTALFQRERTGKGTMVSSSLLANGLWANSYLATAALCGAEFIPRPPRENLFNALSCHYQAADGSWLLLTILNEDRYWPVLARCVEREDLLTDERFATKPDRLRNSRALIVALDEAFGRHERPHWEEVLGENGIVFDIVATPTDIAYDQQVRATGLAVTFPEDERVSTVAVPFRLANLPTVPPRLPPSVGQHTDEVLAELGYDAERTAALRAAGTVA